MIVLLLATLSLAQVPEEVRQGIGADPFADPPPTEEAVREEATRIAKGLRCPVCQGLSVADSTSDAAVQMKDRITELVAYGYTEEQITDYFVDRYGAWVMLAPERGKHRIVWALPWVFGIVGIGAIGAWVLRASRSKQPQASKEPPAPAQTEEDPYRQRILQELGE